MTEQLSIHPRVVKGRTFHEKVNTAKTWKGRGKLKKKREHLNLRRIAHSETLHSLPASTNQLGFKAPGSMK